MDQNSNNIFEFKNVTIELGGEIILKDVSFTVQRGDTMVIIGPSGAGKSVLLKAMVGIHIPKSGSVLFENQNWQSMTWETRHRLSAFLGVQFQTGGLFDSMNVYENIAFPIRDHHPELSESDLRKRIEECLVSVDLMDAQKKMPHELSGGMKHRLAIARALALNPEVLMYDDPTAGLDPVKSDQMAKLLVNLKTRKKSTLIVVTHDMARAYQLAGRIFFVANQTVIETGSVQETKDHPDPSVQQFIHGRIEGPLKIQ